MDDKLECDACSLARPRETVRMVQRCKELHSNWLEHRSPVLGARLVGLTAG